MERINYASTFRTMQKKGVKYTHGVDTIVYMNYIDELKLREMLSFWLGLTVNTNVTYLNLWNDITAYLDVHSTRVGFYYTLHMQKDEFSFPACQFFLNQQDRSVKTNVYWLFFRFCKMYQFDFRTLLPALDFFGIGLNNIVRLDYAFDVFDLTPTNFLEYLKKNKKNRERLNQRNSIEYKKQQVLQTKYIGSKKSKFAFMRLYDKSLDNRQKKKEMYYYDYAEQTTRIEGQFWTNFVKWLSLDEIIDKVFSYMGLSQERNTPYYIGKRYDPNVIANIKTFSEAWIRNTVKLMNNWYDLREATKKVNNLQDTYNLRINLKTKLERSLKRLDSLANKNYQRDTVETIKTNIQEIIL